MKKLLSGLLSIICILAFSACNNTEGEGGTGTIEGNIMLVLHPDDNYNLETDTVVAAKTDVFIVYGNDIFYGDDVKTDDKGFYRFKYLNPGEYTVYAYSTLPTGEKIAVSETIKINKGEIATVPTIYIHEGKAFGTSMIKGRIYAYYYHNGNPRGAGWAYDARVYIMREGEPYHFDDVRVGMDGWFYFQKLTPGNYVVYTFTENLYEVPDTITRKVNIEKAGMIYEIPDTIQIISNV